MKKSSCVCSSELICPTCKNKFPISRRENKSRNKGHHKWMWCPYCKGKRNMLEIRNQDFYMNALGERV